MYRAQLQDLCRDRSGRPIHVLAERAESYRLLAEQWERQGKGRLGTALVPLSAYLAAEEHFKDRPAELDHKRYLSRSGVAPKEFKRLELQLGPALRQQLSEQRRSVKNTGQANAGAGSGPATSSSSAASRTVSEVTTPSKVGSAVKRTADQAANGVGELTPEAKRARAAAIQSGEAFGFSGASSTTTSATSTPRHRKGDIGRLQGRSDLGKQSDSATTTTKPSTPRTSSGRVVRPPAAWPGEEIPKGTPSSGPASASATGKATTTSSASAASTRTPRASTNITPRQRLVNTSNESTPKSLQRPTTSRSHPAPTKRLRYPIALLEGPYEAGLSDSEGEDDREGAGNAEEARKLAPDEEAAQDGRRRARLIEEEKRWIWMVGELKRRDPELRKRLEAHLSL